MSGSHHHSKKGRVRAAETEAERVSAADEVAADLHRQVADSRRAGAGAWER